MFVIRDAVKTKGLTMVVKTRRIPDPTAYRVSIIACNFLRKRRELEVLNVGERAIRSVRGFQRRRPG